MQQLASLSCTSRRNNELFGSATLRRRCLDNCGLPSSHRLAFWRHVLRVEAVCRQPCGGEGDAAGLGAEESTAGQRSISTRQGHCQGDIRDPEWYRRCSTWGQPFVSNEESSKVGGLEGEIFRDVGRTFPQRALFGAGGAGMLPLSRVLKAASRHHEVVGYCQGMNYVAACLLEHTFAAATATTTAVAASAVDEEGCAAAGVGVGRGLGMG